jgi:hypothetical protein
MLGRPVNDVMRTGRLGTSSNKYFIVPVKQVPIHEYSGSEFTGKVCSKRLKYEVGLCVDKNCFLDCRMKMQLKKVQQTHNWYFTYIIRYGIYMSVMCISDLYSRVLNPFSVLVNLSKQGSRRWETSM